MTHKRTVIRDEGRAPLRPRWDAKGTAYYQASDKNDDATGTRTPAKASGRGDDLNGDAVEAELIRRGMRPAQTVTVAWYRLTGEDAGLFRVVALHWGRNDVAFKQGWTCSGPRAMFDTLHAEGLVTREAWLSDDVYTTFLMLGRIEAKVHRGESRKPTDYARIYERAAAWRKACEPDQVAQ